MAPFGFHSSRSHSALLSLIHRFGSELLSPGIERLESKAHNTSGERAEAYQEVCSKLVLLQSVAQAQFSETKVWQSPPVQLYPFCLCRGRHAVSGFQVVEQLAGGRAALVQWRLQTGRTHQIRWGSNSKMHHHRQGGSEQSAFGPEVRRSQSRYHLVLNRGGLDLPTHGKSVQQGPLHRGFDLCAQSLPLDWQGACKTLWNPGPGRRHVWWRRQYSCQLDSRKECSQANRYQSYWEERGRLAFPCSSQLNVL